MKMNDHAQKIWDEFEPKLQEIQEELSKKGVSQKLSDEYTDLVNQRNQKINSPEKKKEKEEKK